MRSREDRLVEITDDMPRWHTLTLGEQLRDGGQAMKNVPLFAVTTMRAAADEIDRLQAEIATASYQSDLDYRAEIDRLRLTAEERAAVAEAVDWYAGVEFDSRCQQIAAALHSLLARLGVTMSDIVFDGMVFDRLREVSNQNEKIAALEAEIARLRLTDAEKDAIRLGELAYPGLRVTDNGKWVNVWATLRGLLERTGSN